MCAGLATIGGGRIFGIVVWDFNICGLVGRWFEQQLSEVVQVVALVRRIVSVRIDVPNVRHVLFIEVTLQPLADTDQSVFVTAGEPQQFELLFCLRGIGNEFFGGLCIWSRREAANPGKRIDVS